MIQCQCEHCQKKFKLKDEIAGKRIRCPQCNEIISIPKSPEATIPRSAKVVRPRPPALIPELTFDEFSANYSEPQLPTRTKQTTVQIGDPYQKPVVHIQPTSNIQVNVSHSNAANSLGISSLVLGLLSFVICWMPGIGQIISGLGLLLGIGGLILAVVRGGSGIGYAISGSVLNGLTLLAGILVLSVMGATAETLSQIGDANTTGNIPQAVPLQTASENKVEDTIKPDAVQDSAVEIAGDTPMVQPEVQDQPQIKTEASEWHSAKESLQLGDIRLTLSKVVRGHVPLSERIGNDTVSEDSLLTIYIELTNTSKSRKIQYTSWMSQQASLLDIDAELTDNFENDYRKVRFGFSSSVKDISTESSIYPGKRIKDAIVFELPVEGIEFLRLKLSAKGIGEDGEFRFQIPSDIIRTKLGSKSQ